MPERQTVLAVKTRDVRDMHHSLDALEASVQQYRHRQAELRLTIMQTRIRLAEVRGTLRRIGGALQSRSR